MKTFSLTNEDVEATVEVLLDLNGSTENLRSGYSDVYKRQFLYEAQEKGYFAEEGLDVDIQSPAGVNDAMSMVAAGKADIGLYYQQDVIQARAEQDVPIKSIGAVVQGPLNIILSLKDKSITKPQDLEGKTIGYAGTELSEALVRSIMQSNGADPNSVNMVCLLYTSRCV